MMKYVRAYLKMQRARKELYSMDQRCLWDMGISRADIDRLTSFKYFLNDA
jgi:uncharacterized protein YjiS (DUF1127 family)